MTSYTEINENVTCHTEATGANVTCHTEAAGNIFEESERFRVVIGGFKITSEDREIIYELIRKAIMARVFHSATDAVIAVLPEMAREKEKIVIIRRFANAYRKWLQRKRKEEQLSGEDSEMQDVQKKGLTATESAGCEVCDIKARISSMSDVVLLGLWHLVSEQVATRGIREKCDHSDLEAGSLIAVIEKNCACLQ
ncbi:MAG: hypothetical protein ACLPX5_12855 [Dissulfurispiraceae bacterium]